MRYRTHQAFSRYKGDENVIGEKKSSFNLMSLSELQQARSRSSQGSGSTSQNEIDEVERSEDSSIADDGIDIEFFTPGGGGDVGVTIWNDELIDFHEGNIQISTNVYKSEQLFTFADISSSEENDEHNSFTPRSSSSSSDQFPVSPPLQKQPSQEGFLFPSVPHLVLASQLQRNGSISSMSSQSQESQNTAVQVTSSRIIPNRRPIILRHKEGEKPSTFSM
jgi:hypothetical protein